MPDQTLPSALAPGGAAVVTGAASGIGLAAARKLAGLGLNVMLADLPGDALDGAVELAREDARDGARVQATPCDVSDRSAVQHLAAESFDAFGVINVLMNNA